MPSRRYPDAGVRYAIYSNGDRAANALITYYLDPAGQNLAPVYAERGTDTPDLADQFAGSTTTLDAFGGQVDFRGPVDGTKKLYAKVGADGPIFEVPCKPQDQIDDLTAAVAAAQADATDALAAAEAAETATASLGDAASRNVGTTADTVAAGNAPAAALASARLLHRAGLAGFRNLAPGGWRTAGPVSALASGASVLGGTNRQFIPVYDSSLQLFYPCFVNSYGSQDILPPNAITVGCALESNGVVLPLTFGGQYKLTLQPGQWAIPDTPPAIQLSTVSLAAGAGTGTVTGFWLRPYVQIAGGQSYVVSNLLNTVLVTGEVNGESSTGGSDLTLTGSGAVTAGNSPLSFAFGPQMILTRPRSHRVFAALGDSIINGQGDTPGTAGWIDRGGAAAGVPVVKIGRNGSTVQDFIVANNRRNRAAQLDGVTDIIVAYGINDLGNNSQTATQLQGYLTTMYAYLAGLGIRVHAATIGPRTTSTDSWATTANQTAVTGQNNTITPSILATVNNWIRGKPAGVYGVIEQGNALMSAPDSGLWKVTGAANGFTTDGTHPNNTGHQTLSAPVLTTYLQTYMASADW